MKKWVGTMKAEGLNAEVIVFHKEATEFDQDIWYGRGVSTTLFSGNRYLMTNIGKIMIGLDSTDFAGSGLDFDFVGYGKPILV